MFLGQQQKWKLEKKRSNENEIISCNSRIQSVSISQQQPNPFNTQTHSITEIISKFTQNSVPLIKLTRSGNACDTQCYCLCKTGTNH